MTYNLITIGDATLDTFIIIDPKDKQTHLDRKKMLLCLNFADKICLNNIDQSVGGNAANVAAGAKKLGHTVAIVTELGDDLNGQTIFTDLQDAGVDTQYIKMLPKKETRFSIVLNYFSERTILSYYVKRKYTFPPLAETQWVYYTSLGESFERMDKGLRQYLQKHPNVKLAMNPGSYQMKNGLKKVRALLSKTDILFVNKDEAQQIYGKKSAIKTLLRGLHKQGVKLVVITDSTNGSYAYDGEQMWFMDQYPIKAVARTGAGDSYASGFLSAIMYGKNIPTAMQWGTANAGGVIQKVGAHKGLQTRHGIAKTIKKHLQKKPKIL